MTDNEVATKIVELVGGKENISVMRHCATRLRLIVKDKEKIDTNSVEALKSVKGSFFNSGQYQIILGTGLINRVYDEVVKIKGADADTSADADAKPVYGNRLQRAIRMFSDVFVPIIPVLVLLTYTRVLTDTAFAFLPSPVCRSTMRNFGGSPIIGSVLSLMLVNPALPNAYYVEKWLRKHIPDAVDLILTPFLTLLAGTIFAIFLIGPVLHMVKAGLLTVVKGLLFLPMGLGGLIYGSCGQLMGIFGIHHVLNFLEISMLARDGWNYLNPIGTCGMA